MIMNIRRGLINAWCLIDLKYHLKQKIHFGSRLYTGGKGKTKMPQVLNLDHHEKNVEEIEILGRVVVFRNANDELWL